MRTRLLLLLLLLALLGGRAAAEPVVVVSASSSIGPLSQEQVVNIFLGRYRSLPGGGIALSIDQPESEPLRADFYRRLVNKNLNEINAYWSRLMFSGRTTPPLQAASAADVMVVLAKYPDSIAYIERQQADKRVRIVLEFPR